VCNEPTVVAVNGESREPVPLAKDQTASDAWPIQAKNIPAKGEGSVQPGVPEGVVKRFILPAVKTNPNRASRVVETPGDEMTVMGDDLNLTPTLGRSLQSTDRGVEDPGMTGEEWARAARLEDDAGIRHGLCNRSIVLEKSGHFGPSARLVASNSAR
jgi:hypothetical protein